MAWSEVIEKRNKNSRTYQQDEKYNWSGTLAILHYKDDIDGDVYNNEVNCSPIRIDNASFDGWRVVENSWHYALGQPVGENDGWVGFGGRQGEHWFRFRLAQVGYLHWPTRSWNDVGGPANYDRSNLSSETHSIVIGPNDDEIFVESSARWSKIWETPNGGSLDVSWKVRGDQLKEEIIINQLAREWIITNRPPATALDETWFGFVFRLDWSDMPRVYRAQILQNPDTDDFSDDGESIELRDAQDRLLAFMPIDYVKTGTEKAEEKAILRKRFYKNGDNHYLVVGVRCDTLAAMQSGDLVFDPTVNEQITANADDGEEDYGDAWYEDGYTNQIFMGIYYDGFSSLYQFGGFRFQTVNVPQGSTIDTATLQLYGSGLTGVASEVLLKIIGDDVDDAAVWVNGSSMPSTITQTTAKVDFDPGSWPLGSWNSLPDISAIVEEIVGRGGWSANNDIRFAIVDDGQVLTDNSYIKAVDYSYDSAYSAKLDIEYSSGGVARQPRYGFTNFQIPAIV